MITEKVCAVCKSQNEDVFPNTVNSRCISCKNDGLAPRFAKFYANYLKTEEHPTKLVHTGVNVAQTPSERVKTFEQYKLKVAETINIITLADRTVLAIPASSKSRYFLAGRKRMQSNIKKRLGTRWFSPGCLVTLTYAPQRVSKEEAWRNIAADKKRFLHAINTRRYRNHTKGLKYLWAIENQPGTGYPHIHIFFPNLNYFMPAAELNHLWPWGMTDVHHKDNINCASYLCSYLSKLEDWDIDSQSQIWANKTRVYGYTANYKLPLSIEKLLVDGSYGGSFRPHFNIEGKICGDKQEVALNLLMGGYKLGSGWEDLYEKNN